MRDFGENLFKGTAEFYSKYRAHYPPEMFADIVQCFGLGGRGRMLDLGCGTGELSIPLAAYFTEVLAIDPEPEMLEEGKLKAQKAGVNNIEWLKGSSKELKRVKGPYKLATLGQSLHWMDEKTVINQLYDLLEPGGGLLIVGSGGQSQSKPQSKAASLKDQAIKALVTKYLGPARRAGDTIYKPSGLSWEQNLFPNSKFGKFEKRIYYTIAVRNADQELGNLYSMSWARREFFGPRISQFDAEARQALSKISGSNEFENTLRFEAYYLDK